MDHSFLARTLLTWYGSSGVALTCAHFLNLLVFVLLRYRPLKTQLPFTIVLDSTFLSGSRTQTTDCQTLKYNIDLGRSSNIR